ncbi:hypothetical protein [Acinetobacter sp. c3-l95]|uniref:hypothetical protein n=1 Tax=Acinetobacter sp. c3-l95 TaxID=3342804 RepID=UPI0035BB88E5
MIIFLVLILFGLKHYLSNKVAEKNQHITPTPIETARPAQSYPSTKYLPKLPRTYANLTEGQRSCSQI